MSRWLRVVLAVVVVGLAGWWVHRERVCSPGACVLNPATTEAPAQQGQAEPAVSLPASPQPSSNASPALTQGWQRLTHGLDYRVQEVAGGSARLVALRVDLDRFRLEVVDLAAQGKQPMTVRQLAQARDAVAAINGGFFDENWRPLGLLIHAGKRSNPLRQADWGIFAVTPTGPRLRHTRQGVPPGTIEALQCGPRLVIAGRVPRFKPGESRRAGIGISGDGRIVLAATASGLLSLREFARALKEFGCVDAMNLDGGPSAQMYLRSGALEIDVPGAYGVPSAIVVVPR